MEPEILSGPFTLEAKVTLLKLEGTAASVRFGDRLNFGFDGRSRTFFAEGKAVGQTKLLAKSDTLIKQGVPFDLKAVRTKDGSLTVSVNGKEVFLTDRVKGEIGQIQFRPMRNSISVSNATINGKINVRPEGIQIEPIVAPILNDGSSQTLLHFQIKTDKPRAIRRIRLSLNGTTQLSDLSAVSISSIKENGEPIAQLTSPKNKAASVEVDHAIESGLHKFWLQCQLAEEADLLNKIQVTIESIQFEDGTFWRPALNENLPSAQRTAYCVHKKKQHNCHTFRIPAITRTPNGTLLAVYDMRYNSSRDLQEHIDIGLSRSTDGGQTWSEPIPIMDMGEYGGKPQKENGCSDPGILVDQNTGEIFVSAVWTYGKPNTHQWSGKGSEPGLEISTTAQFMVVRSSDDGRSWSQPENWTKKLKKPEWWLFAPAPGNGITLKNGTLVMPTQGRDKTGLPFSNITYSQDHGKTWTVSKPARTNTTECAVAELSDGSLMLNMRDNRNRSQKGDENGRAVGTTNDLGKTWAVHSSDHGGLPEPVCMASLIRHQVTDDKQILLFSNPNDKHSRKRMTIQLSHDDGITWPEKHRLMLDQHGGAYSSLVMIDDETIGILYESSRADLVFQKIRLRDLTK